MKKFAHKIFAHRKIILIFLLAIFLPLLIVAYLSFNTLSKRREAVKKLLESNLWISGDAALKSIEGALIEYEKTNLKSEYFIRIIQPKYTDKISFNSLAFSKDSTKQILLLNADYKIILPENGSENASEIQGENEIANTQFSQHFRNAEFYEFSQKNYTHAAELYNKCHLYTYSLKQQAISLEGLGRCLLASKKYGEAILVYSELSKNYGQLQNEAGHPFGIVAALQLSEISDERKHEEKIIEILLELYGKIREGTWPISLPVYDFYITEIETKLNSKFSEGKLLGIQKSYTNLRKQPSTYRNALVFSDFVNKNIIPIIKEKTSLSGVTEEAVPARLLISSGKDFSLVSYTVLSNFQSGQTFYAGFCWDLNNLKTKTIPNIFQDLTKDSGLNFKIIDERGQNIITGKEEQASKESPGLTFRTVPLPWKLLVNHPEIKDLEKNARKEIFIYGFLLFFILALMLLGAVLLARDISRESETTNLKTEFVHNISHELKTPLTLIRLYGETLQRKENLTNEEKKECYEIITKESERLSHLINNVLDFSRIETGRKEFDIKKGNLAEVIRDTLESYRYHLEKKGFSIQMDIVRDLPEINFDGEAIASLLINLLSNAIKFSPKEKEVSVTLFRDDGNAVLQVADKGVGISPDDVPKIFQRFYQVQNNTVAETRGSGIGLTLVKHITEAHNGRIKVESEPGKGSIFSVIMPISDT